MNKKLISLAIAAAVAAPLAAQAGSLNVANQDITLSGGIAGGYVYNTDTKLDAITATDALVDLASEAKAGGVGFDLGVGVLAAPNLSSSSSVLNTATSGNGTAFQYGWLTIMPTEGLSFQAGTLATNVGYEVVPSYNDANIFRGLVWGKQPAYYNGVRANYSMGNMNVYVEGNKNAAGCLSSSGNCSGSAVGISGSFGNVNGAFNFFDVANGGSMYDFIASSKVGSMTLAANIDYLQKAKVAKTPGTDDNAYGIALYASFPMGEMAELPMRLEYVNDGTSGLYGLTSSGATETSKSAYTFTITPTYNFSKATFARAELAYVTTDKKSLYVDDKGAFKDTNLVVGLQGGLRF